MAQTAAQAVLRQSINLSYNDIQKALPDAPEYLIKDLFNKQSNINDLAQVSGSVEDQVILNTDQIEINVIGISVNAGNISTNTGNISSVTTNFNDHNASDTEHGVTGFNVGTGDFAQSLIGGTVLLADKVADAVASTVSVDSPAATDLPTVITLANELKGEVNQLVTDFNNLVTKFNAFLLANQTAKQMAP